MNFSKGDLLTSWIIGLSLIICISHLTNAVEPQNVVDLIKQHPNLTKMADWVEKDPLIAVVLVVSQCTVFAPTDEAFKKYVGSQGNDLSKNYASLHTTGILALPDVFPTKVSSFSAASPNLFLLKKNVDHSTAYQKHIITEYYVNNAKIVSKAQSIDNKNGQKQVLYIIDEVITPYERRPLPPNAFEAIEEANSYANIGKEDVKKFLAQIEKNHLDHLFKQAGMHTFFVPITITDKALQSLDSTVIKGHIIPSESLFLRTMDTDKPYKSGDDDDKAKVELSLVEKDMNDSISNINYYIQSNTIFAKDPHQLGVVKVRVNKGNIPVSNGVIHFIDAPLMIIQDNIQKILETERSGQLSQFYNFINKNEEIKARLTGTSLTTLLAPTDEAFRRVDHILKNLTYNDLMNIIRLHFVADQSISSESVKDANKEFNSMSDNKPLHFNSYIKDEHRIMSVEGGGVNASVIQADIGATNGIVHKIDKVLGVSVQTIKEKLASDQRLRTTYNVGEFGSGSWDSRLDLMDTKFTLFAPSSDAWEYMKNTWPSEYKQLTEGMYPQNAERILDRHLAIGKILLADDLKENMEIETARGSVTIKKDELNRLIIQWENIEALITRSNVHAINGVIHEIDKVLMIKKDLAVSPALALNNNNKGSSLVITILPIILMVIIKLI